MKPETRTKSAKNARPGYIEFFISRFCGSCITVLFLGVNRVGTEMILSRVRLKSTKCPELRHGRPYQIAGALQAWRSCMDRRWGACKAL